MLTKKIDISGLACTGCASRARNTLLALTGVVKVITNIDEDLAEVTYNEQEVEEHFINQALINAGFNAQSGHS